MAAKRKPRLPDLPDDQLTQDQRELKDSILSGPRGNFKFGGPFAVWLHAPRYGQLAQRLGAHVRYKTAVPPRLSEFAILCTARIWRAQYEWEAHAPMAERAGVLPQTIRELQRGRRPTNAPADERLLYDFIKQLYRDRRVSDALYKKMTGVLGEAATVELVGILGYYAMISMTLNVFAVPVEGEKLPFREPRPA
jgi:4-carboxymuconolactone decarboxylase